LNSIVINKTIRPLVVAKPLGTDKAQGGRMMFEGVRLLPGSNEVDAITLEAMSKSATVQSWLSKNMIELPKPAKDGEGVSAYEPAQALQLIADCFDQVILDRWLDVEKRKDIRAAIKARQKELIKALARED
jgi:hypothetical protein